MPSRHRYKNLFEQQAICFRPFLFRCICCRSGAASATTGQQTRQSECRLRSLKFIFIRYRKNQALFHLAPCRQVLTIKQNYALAMQAKQMLVKLFLTACCKCLCPILTKCSTANIFSAQKKTSEEVFWVTELLLLFICSSYATSANIFGGFLSVYFHLYFFEVGAVRSRSLSVGVAHKIAGHLAFTANCTNF